MLVFLLTDIEGSTKKWEQYPDEMKQALEMHDRILRQNIEAYGGHLIKHTGDGVFAVFEQGDPLRCALQIQHDFENSQWGKIGELRIRVALHEGVAEKRNNDYFGPEINRTARVMAAAWGGQIVITPAVTSAASIPGDASLKDLGLHLLKDLTEPQHIYQLLHPELLLQNFPPLRSLSGHPHNLPVQSTPFLGREEDLKKICERLEMPSCRLISIIGAGGIGKTRLALQVGAEMIEEFKHGVYFIPLASLDSDDYIIPTIAHSLNFSFYSRQDEKSQLFGYLREKEMLLILDNFEHLVDAAPVILELIASARACKILVTSRELMNLQGEWLYNVQGMELPDGKGTFEENDAVQLFLYHAQRVNAEIDLERDRPAILRICELVSGLPLGIELAVSWLRTLSCQDVAHEIAQTYDFLSTSFRDMPIRHRSLRAVFDYSWNLLTSYEQNLLMCLSVFRGGFTRQAAEEVTDIPLSLLSSLIDKSLLRCSSSGRYEVLETVRQYASERLQEHPDIETAVKKKHSDYFASIFEKKWKHSSVEKHDELLREIGANIENIRTAWQWAIEHGGEDVIIDCLVTLHRFYRARDWQREGEEILGRGLKKLQERWGHEHTEEKRQMIIGMLLSRQGSFCDRLGLYEKAKELIEKSIAIFERLSIWKEEAWATYYLANVFYDKGSFDKAKSMYERSYAVSKKIANERGMGAALNCLGLIAGRIGDFDKAKSLFHQSLDIRQRIIDKSGVASCYINIGNMESRQGDYRNARNMYEHSLAIYREIDYKSGIALALNNLGDILTLTGAYEKAGQMLKESLALYENIGDRLGIGLTFVNLGDISLRSGHLHEADGLLKRSLAIFQQIGYQRGIGWAYNFLAKAAYSADHEDEAEKYYYQALDVGVTINDLTMVTAVVMNIAHILVKRCAYEAAFPLVVGALQHRAASEETKKVGEDLLEVINDAGIPGTDKVRRKRQKRVVLERVAKRMLREYNSAKGKKKQGTKGCIQRRRNK